MPSPNTIMFWVGISTYEFWEDKKIQSITMTKNLSIITLSLSMIYRENCVQFTRNYIKQVGDPGISFLFLLTNDLL